MDLVRLTRELCWPTHSHSLRKTRNVTWGSSSVAVVSCEEFYTNQLQISWQISTENYICLETVKWSGGGQFSWINSAHQFIIHQRVEVSAEKEKKKKKSLIFYSHTFLCTSGLTTGLRELDEFKASEESRAKESQIRTEIRLENLINQECLWRGNTFLKTIWTFQPQHLFWAASIGNKLLRTGFSSLSLHLRKHTLCCLHTVHFLWVINKE